MEDINNHCYNVQRRLQLMMTDIAHDRYKVTDFELLEKFEDTEDDIDSTSNDEIDKFLQKI